MKKKEQQSGFRVPDGYFTDLNARLKERIETSPGDLPDSEGFTIPPGYFEALGERLLREAPDKKVIRLTPLLKYWPAAAAVAAVVSLLFLMPPREAAKPSFDDLAGAEIATYMERSVMEFTDEEMAQLFSVEDLEMSDMLDQQLTEEHILEYLDASLEDYDELNIEIDE